MMNLTIFMNKASLQHPIKLIASPRLLAQVVTALPTSYFTY